jgi:predicted Zn-dependent peptidase
MKSYKNLIICLIIFIIFFTIPAASRINDAGIFLKDNVVHKTMPNGINVLMLNRGYAPTLALLISFRVGSSDESYKTIGVAHMLEHMLFKGTDKIGTTDYQKEKIVLDKIEEVGERLNILRLKDPESKEAEELQASLNKLQEEHRKFVVSSPYSKIYAENGGVGFNASTSKDMTVYYLELPSSKLEIWAELESERLRNPVFREFYIEKGAVLEERLNRYESDGEGSLFEQFTANAFIAHPYRHPTIGWKSNIESFSIKDVQEFYKKNYTPSRMTITVVGKQNPEETYKTLIKYFGTMTGSDDSSDTVIAEPEQKGERRFDLYFESNPSLVIGWHKPSFPSRTDYIFDFIEDLLTEGKTSRLYKSLVIDKGLAASVYAWNGFPGSRYDNLFLIGAMPKAPASPDELEKAIYKEIEKLALDVSEEDIKNVINRKESSFIFQMDNNMGIARILSYYQTNFEDWKYTINYLNILKSITPGDIKEAIKEYLQQENRTVGILRDSSKTK